MRTRRPPKVEATAEQLIDLPRQSTPESLRTFARLKEAIRDSEGSGRLLSSLRGMSLAGIHVTERFKLNFVDFTGCDLRGTKLRPADVHECDFSYAKIDEETELPFRGIEPEQRKTMVFTYSDRYLSLRLAAGTTQIEASCFQPMISHEQLTAALQKRID